MTRRNIRTGMTISETTLELDVEISGSPIPYSPAVMHLSNGDPGYPEEGGYAEDIAVFLIRKDKDGKEHRLDITDFLSEDQIKDISDQIMERARDDFEDAKASAAESRAECQREMEWERRNNKNNDDDY